MNNPLKYTDPSGYVAVSSYDKCQADPNCTNLISNGSGPSHIEVTTTLTLSNGQTAAFTVIVPFDSFNVKTINDLNARQSREDYIAKHSHSAVTIQKLGNPPSSRYVHSDQIWELNPN